MYVKPLRPEFMAEKIRTLHQVRLIVIVYDLRSGGKLHGMLLEVSLPVQRRGDEETHLRITVNVRLPVEGGTGRGLRAEPYPTCQVMVIHSEIRLEIQFFKEIDRKA